MSKRAIYILGQPRDKIYAREDQQRLEAALDILPGTHRSDALGDVNIEDVEIILSSWGAPQLDESFLDRVPKLEAIFYAAGSVRGFVTDAVWDRNITVCSAFKANAVPVAEFALSQILFSLKCGWQHERSCRSHETRTRFPVAGGYGSKVGLISLGAIARLVAQHLQNFDLQVIAYDPFVDNEQAAALGVELRNLDAVFREADVVSLHTPNLDETAGMITGAHIASMKQGATFLNTARGRVVREPEMIEALTARPDLQAVLDVTYPEPPEADSPLYQLENIALTPHIAGSMDAECQRMGRYMTDDILRYLTHHPLEHQVTREQAQHMA